jgi:hypothetical protein
MVCHHAMVSQPKYDTAVTLGCSTMGEVLELVVLI